MMNQEQVEQIKELCVKVTCGGVTLKDAQTMASIIPEVLERAQRAEDGQKAAMGFRDQALDKCRAWEETALRHLHNEEYWRKRALTAESAEEHLRKLLGIAMRVAQKQAQKRQVDPRAAFTPCLIYLLGKEAYEACRDSLDPNTDVDASIDKLRRAAENGREMFGA